MPAGSGRPRWWVVAPALTAFAEAGVLTLGEVHLAATLARLAGPMPDDPDHDAVVLAAAFAARASRLGHVGVDLSSVAADVTLDPSAGDPGDGSVQVTSLPWPDPATWLAKVAASPLVAATGDTVTPLVVHGGLLYLERSRASERAVARALLSRAPDADGRPVSPAPGIAATLLTGPGSDRQLAAVASSFDARLTVLLGGPGTGKTTTVAALVAALIERGGAPVSIALAAPTGKAAARLGEAFAEAAVRLPAELAEPLAATPATTIHRLLGTVPLSSGSSASGAARGVFRHHGRNPLPHDIVIVDESSMVSLPLMARLLDALRPDARLVIVGDPDQLASVDAGSVLGDLARAAGDGSPIAACVTRLEHSRRFPAGSPIAELAEAVRAGDADRAVAVLADPGSAAEEVGRLRWVDRPADDPGAVTTVRDVALGAAAEVGRHAATGEAAEALAALGRVRVLCAHRTGPAGVERWNRRFEQWLETPPERWYVGRPVLVTENDHRNGLYNGDLGVVVVSEGRRTVAFPDPAGVKLIGPARLHAVETTHAMTIHKSQGSEFDEVVVVLPAADSRLATRELLYTAVTRARSTVTVVGDAEAVRAAVERRTVRLSRLADDLLGGLGS